MDAADVNFANQMPLVVDDESFSLSIVVRILRDLKFSAVIEANDGQKAMDIYASENSPSLSIIDFNMPGVNGLQILKAVRTGQTKMPRDHRILMLTGNADFGLVRAAIDLDVDSFIAKPASKQILTARLEKVLSENQDLKSIDDYEGVDIDSVNKRFLGHEPLGVARTPAPPDTRSDYVERRVALNSIQAGAIVGKSIRSPTGELLINRGTALTERLIRRLKELQDVLGIQYLDIMVPLPRRDGP